MNKTHKSINSINYYLKKIFICSRKFDHYEAQLEFERLKREKLEAQLDECRHEIARLVNTLRSYEERILLAQVRFSFNSI